MGLLEKIKNALFEDDDDEEEKVSKKETRFKEEKIAKKIDISRTTEELPVKEEIPMQPLEFKTPEKPKGPIIFDDDDFLSDTKELHFKEVPKKEEKILYGGYETKLEEKTKEKFRPSPIISPVYGLVEPVGKKESTTSERKTLDHIFVEERKKEINFDSIREKAFGVTSTKKQEEPVVTEEKSLLYDMQEENDLPSIGKITLGDAEEYFEDLGLEYEVDYKDEAKQNITRSLKNKELTETIEEEIKEEIKIEEEQQEIKETPKKTRATRTKKKEIEVVEESPVIEEEYQEPEEKNLYDLIDMMYESKE